MSSESEAKSGAKQEIVSVTYEEIGLFPRSFSRVLDRFLKQVFSDVENLVIQEYRFYRYLFLTTVRCLFILFFVPFLVNFVAKNYLIHPLTEYYWNTKQSEIFLNSYQQKRAFAELKEFEEKLYFESLIYSKPSGKTASIYKSELFSKTSPKSLERGLWSTVTVDQNAYPLTEKGTSISVDGKSLILDKTNLNGNNKVHSTLKGVDLIKPGLDLTINGNEKINLEKEFVSPLIQRGPLIQGMGKNSGKTLTTQDYDMVTVNNLQPLVNQTIMDKNGSTVATFAPDNKVIYNTLNYSVEPYKKLQEKTIEIATRYNTQSIEAITNFFADCASLVTLFYLLFALEIQINITKSFLLEVFFGLDDSKKSLLILLVTDLLVGYHSSNIWELFFEFLFNHYGLPESQTGIFLLVATLPVLLDVLFKYLIFRHLNRSSPATVATYHAMIE